MSLISLLIALAAQRSLSSPIWQFSSYFRRYCQLAINNQWVKSPWQSSLSTFVFLLLPVVLVYLVLAAIDDTILHLGVSTLLLIVCFGCVQTRECYKNYLNSAFRGELTTCELHHQQLQQDKNLADMSFGQILVWLNFRYFIAIMIFFVLFGAPGALFYRLLLTLVENAALKKVECEQAKEQVVEQSEHLELADVESESGMSSDDFAKHTATDQSFVNQDTVACDYNAEVHGQLQKLLFILEWPLVRIVAFCYMLVGHFSKAFPIWLESVFNVSQSPHRVLVNVAEKSEDFMIDEGDCSAEPCILVRLAKRTLLLCLALVSILIITGVIA